MINPDRLGNTADRLTSRQISYVNLTDGPGVRKKHQHFGTTADANDIVHAFFKAALHGERALPRDGFEFNTDLNAWELT